MARRLLPGHVQSWMNRSGFAIPGVRDVQGCGRVLQPGRVVAPGLCPESLVPGGDAGELQHPGLTGDSLFQAKGHLPVRARRRPLDGGEWSSPRRTSRMGKLV
ncbi:ZNF879 isoform 3 [Pan troglodytes]|uniref:ZNF879 isoform 3 n=1 Tax=Pan troglodytes TaxID=9598 RepID=A0A2J8JTS8_PANTR|nr:ZNF879 isoform 3 [Pan troglodytes]